MEGGEGAMLIELLGWVGVLGTLSAYLLSVNGRLGARSLRYAVLNAVGGLLCAIAAAFHGAWPNAASSAVWSAVGIHAVATTVAARLRPGGIVVRARFGRVRETRTDNSIAC